MNTLTKLLEQNRRTQNWISDKQLKFAKIFNFIIEDSSQSKYSKELSQGHVENNEFMYSGKTKIATNEEIKMYNYIIDKL